MFDRLRTRLDAGRQDGFTLIELLIVIVILGVLAGIVVFAVGGITDRGDLSACKSDKKTLEVASEAHFAQNRTYVSATDLADKNFIREAPADMTVNLTTGVITVASPPRPAGC